MAPAQSRIVTVAVIGGGLMGTGLARLFTGLGWPVRVSEPASEARALLARAVPHALATADLAEAVHGADFVIEAASERIEVKRRIFAALAHAAPPGIPLATNSSVIPVGEVASELAQADAARVVGAHFWNPPDVIPLVEVIQGPRSDPAAIAAVMAILRDAGREPVHVRRDTVPGNRMQHALWREAMALVDEGVCSAEEVDHIVTRSFGLRLAVLGPLANADLVGLELTEQIHRVVLPVLSRRQSPAETLVRLRAEGAEGVRSGRGFHSGWTEHRVATLRGRLARHLASLLSKPGDDP